MGGRRGRGGGGARGSGGRGLWSMLSDWPPRRVINHRITKAAPLTPRRAVPPTAHPPCRPPPAGLTCHHLPLTRPPSYCRSDTARRPCPNHRCDPPRPRDASCSGRACALNDVPRRAVTSAGRVLVAGRQNVRRAVSLPTCHPPSADRVSPWSAVVQKSVFLLVCCRGREGLAGVCLWWAGGVGGGWLRPPGSERQVDSPPQLMPCNYGVAARRGTVSVWGAPCRTDHVAGVVAA